MCQCLCQIGRLLLELEVIRWHSVCDVYIILNLPIQTLAVALVKMFDIYDIESLAHSLPDPPGFKHFIFIQDLILLHKAAGSSQCLFLSSQDLCVCWPVELQFLFFLLAGRPMCCLVCLLQSETKTKSVQTLFMWSLFSVCSKLTNLCSHRERNVIEFRLDRFHFVKTQCRYQDWLLNSSTQT